MQELFKKYLNNQCSPEEVKLLLKEFDLEENKELLSKLINEQLEADDGLTVVNEKDHENILAEIYQDIRTRINTEKKIKSPVVRLRRRPWFRIAAAAVILFVIVATYLLVNRTSQQQATTTDQALTSDILPGGNKAVLTLANNSKIILEKAANGKIAQEGNASISKLNDAQIVYAATGSGISETFFNSVATPRGGQYQLTLADGSRVWLNSASSIRFPASFDGDERKVEISGEVYFEVAKDVSRPFKINVAGKEEVQVLGTHFNVNCYADETTMNTTLLTGSIKVTSFATQGSQLLSPGQQAKLNGKGQILVEKKPDLDKVMAWKNGYFNFDGADTRTVMRLLSRWYDIDVVYEGSIPEREFGGEIEKNLSFSQVLKVLEKNNLHFRLEGRKLTVTP